MVALIEPLFSEIIVAGWPVGDPLPYNVTRVRDNFPGRGPLAGIEAALESTGSSALFVFGGDMPWLSEELIRREAEEYVRVPADILAASYYGLTEPLHSIYSRTIHSRLAEYLRSGQRPAVIDFFRLVNTRYFDLPPEDYVRRALTNINRPEDLDADV